MKRSLVTFALIASLLVSSVTLYAKEPEASAVTYDEFIEEACEIFPEHADMIKEYPGTATTDLFEGEPVLIDTFEPEDGQIWTYQEYATGASVVSFYKTWSVTSSSSGAAYYDYTGTLTVTCNMSNDIFQRCNFKYRIYSGAYDEILSAGTSTGTTCSASLLGSRTRETSSSGAYYQYAAYFTPRDYLAIVTCYCTITLTVKNNNFSTSLNY